MKAGDLFVEYPGKDGTYREVFLYHGGVGEFVSLLVFCLYLYLLGIVGKVGEWRFYLVGEVIKGGGDVFKIDGGVVIGDVGCVGMPGEMFNFKKGEGEVIPGVAGAGPCPLTR